MSFHSAGLASARRRPEVTYAAKSDRNGVASAPPSIACACSSQAVISCEPSTPQEMCCGSTTTVWVPSGSSEPQQVGLVRRKPMSELMLEIINQATDELVADGSPFACGCRPGTRTPPRICRHPCEAQCKANAVEWRYQESAHPCQWWSSQRARRTTPIGRHRRFHSRRVILGPSS